MYRLAFSVILFFSMITGTYVSAQTFTYPDVPSSIVNRQERIDYLAGHFWDNCDFSSARLFASPKAVLDFIYLLKSQSYPNASSSIDKMIVKAQAYPDAFSTIQVLFQRYLHDSQSTFYDDELYMIYLEAVLSSDVESALKIVPEYQLGIVRKNRVGYPAEDFSFMTQNGEEMSLYDIRSEWLLLCFINPTCSACHSEQEELLRSTAILGLLGENRLTVLSLDPGIEYAAWQASSFPVTAGFLAGYDYGGSIRGQRLYDVQRIPVYYLMDSNKIVVLKEATLEKVVARLGTIYNNQ